MQYSENAINILAAKTYKGIGRAWISKNLNKNKTIDSIVSLLNRDSKESYDITLQNFEENRESIRKDILNLKGFVDGVVAIGDPEFPPHRGEVKGSERPVALFYRGDLSLLRSANKNIAVIGLLSPDSDIEKIEKGVVAELVKNGATIVSGLALGCDSIAHRQTLDLNGETIAILPSPLGKVLPTANVKLADEIVQSKGLVITEYYTDAQSKKELSGRYQERDRLQALFSDSVILMASYAKNNQGNDSGSRLAMGYALDYSIPRAVVYDSVNDANNDKYDLNRQLIMGDDNQKLTVINPNNGLVPTIKKIMSTKQYSDRATDFQPDLFSSMQHSLQEN